MKIIASLAVSCCISLVSFAQANKVELASIALEKKNFEEAYATVNDALKTPQSLNKNTLAKAYFIRGKAGTKISHEALINGDEESKKKYVDIPLQCYDDFKKAQLSGDTAMMGQIKQEYNKLGNALLTAGTKYDGEFNDNPEKADSALLDKGIANFTASIEVFQLIGKEKFKCFLFRGDAQFNKNLFPEATKDYTTALELFETTPHDNPDFNIGDLCYRLAYMQAAIYKKKDDAMQTIAKGRKLLDGEMQLAETKKEKLGARYEDCKADFKYFNEQLDELEKKVSK